MAMRTSPTLNLEASSMRRSPVIATFLAAASVAIVATAQSPSRLPTAATPDDPTIVAIFDAANTADIETGRLAVERAADPAVREFGAMLARDHEQVRQLGRDLAKKLGVTPTPPKDDASAKAHAAAMASLRAKSGADFDRAFLRHEAAFHKSVIDAVNGTLLPAIRNEELRALVVKVAPAFQAHMLAAQNLETKLAAPSSSNRYR
jgi:putative membrane protein